MLGKGIETLVVRAREDADVLAVILFGSLARGEAVPSSDTDVCLVLEGRRHRPVELSKKKLEYLALGDLDVQVFQQLPLYVRSRILREGRVLLVKDEDRLYDVAFGTARAFEDFRHHYEAYLKDVAGGGS